MVSNVQSFFKDIYNDTETIVYGKKIDFHFSRNSIEIQSRVTSLYLRITGIVSCVLLTAATIAFIVNPQISVPVAIFLVAEKVFALAFSYDALKMGINSRNKSEITKEEFYKGTVFKNIYYYMHDNKLFSNLILHDDDEQKIRAYAEAARINGVFFAASLAMGVIDIAIVPLSSARKIILLTVNVFGIFLFNELRLLGECVRKSNQEITFGKCLKETLMLKYIFKYT